jgi:hypothetical protein
MGVLVRALTSALLAALILAAPALADGISSTVKPSASDPTRLTVKVTATSTAMQPVSALVRVAGGPCAASFSDDTGVTLASAVLVSGTVSISHEITAAPGGHYVVCAWLGSGAPVSTPFDTPAPACGPPVPPSVALVSRCAAPPTHCVVPRAPSKLSTAKARLTGAGCRVGKLTRVRSSRASGTVLRYTAKRGKRLHLGAKVGIVVAR